MEEIIDSAQGIATVVYSLLVQSVAMFSNNFKLAVEEEISGTSGKGSAWYSILEKDKDWNSSLVVRRAKDKVEDAVAENMMQLQAISSQRKRNLQMMVQMI